MKTAEEWLNGYPLPEFDPITAKHLHDAYNAGAAEKEREIIKTLKRLMKIKCGEINTGLSNAKWKEPMATKLSKIVRRGYENRDKK